jgi:DNA-binding XRE family transcriptional regulator
LFISLKEAREAAGYTQTRLAAKLKVSNTKVSDWERGRAIMGEEFAQKAAKILDIPPRRLYFSQKALFDIRREATRSDPEHGILGVVKSTVHPEIGVGALKYLRDMELDELAKGDVATKAAISNRLASGDGARSDLGDVSVDATGSPVVQGADGYWYVVDVTQSPPTTIRVQVGPVVQAQAGNRASLGGTRDQVGRSRRGGRRSK